MGVEKQQLRYHWGPVAETKRAREGSRFLLLAILLAAAVFSVVFFVG